MATHPKTAKPKAPKQVLTCGVCDFKTKESYYAKQELGRHMKFVHGVNGASSSAQLMQSKKESTNPLAISEFPMDIKPLLEEPQPREKRTYTRRSNINVGYDTEALITVGRLIAICEAQAEKLGTSKESFTRRCAELFYASQVRP